jgi:NAD(P)-dependent dehydrogenase (short-subunit alcohol dehydrogenase family)
MYYINRRTVLAGLTAAMITESFAETPRSPFGATSTAEEVTKGLDLRGKNAMVTGCNSGVGFETMRVLALRGAHVVGTARSLEKGREACALVKGRTTPVALELTDFSSVVECGRQIRALMRRIDILVLNAGISLDTFERVNGLEKHFVVNHLGHFILANRVLDLVHAAPQGRVVTVGSGSHAKAPPGGIQFDDLSGKGWSDKAYAHSKLANGLFSLELAKRLAGTPATSNCVTPGAVHTNIFNTWSKPVEREAKTPEQGAATQCYVATSPQLAKTTGEYFKDCNPAPQSAFQRDAAMAAKLWDVSTELTRKYLA